MKLQEVLTESTQFRPALKVIAAELAAEVDSQQLDYDSVDDVASDLVQGRWIEMLKDEIVDILIERKGR